jgi:hypothetical protein
MRQFAKVISPLVSNNARLYMSFSQQAAIKLSGLEVLAASAKKELLGKVIFAEDVVSVLKGNIDLDKHILAYLVSKVNDSKNAALALCSRNLPKVIESNLMHQINNVSDAITALSGGKISDENAKLLIEGRYFQSSEFGLKYNTKMIKEKMITTSSQACEVLSTGLVQSEQVQKQLIEMIDDSSDAAKVLVRGHVLSTLSTALIKNLSIEDTIFAFNEIAGDIFEVDLVNHGKGLLQESIANMGDEDGRDKLAAFIEKLRPKGFYLGELELILERVDDKSFSHNLGEMTAGKDGFPMEEFLVISKQIIGEVNRNNVVGLASDLRSRSVDVDSICMENDQGKEIIKKLNDFNREIEFFYER